MGLIAITIYVYIFGWRHCTRLVSRKDNQTLHIIPSPAPAAALQIRIEEEQQTGANNEKSLATSTAAAMSFDSSPL